MSQTAQTLITVAALLAAPAFGELAPALTCAPPAAPDLLGQQTRDSDQLGLQAAGIVIVRVRATARRRRIGAGGGGQRAAGFCPPCPFKGNG